MRDCDYTQCQNAAYAFRCLPRVSLPPTAKQVIMLLSPMPEKTAGGPRLPGVPLGMAFGGGTEQAPDVELFLDLTCPLSGKLFTTVYPAMRPGGALHGKAHFVFQHVVQPWHAQSEAMHTAVLAVRALKGKEAALDFCLALYEAHDDFTDEAVADETRLATMSRLVALAGVVVQERLEELLPLTTKDQEDHKTIEQVLKWTILQHRTRGVHTTPTVFVHGIEAPQVTSSWTTDQWAQMLDELTAALPAEAA